VGVRPRLLVVDDDPLRRGVYRRFLTAAGIEVHVTANEHGAERRLSACAFDAVIVDLRLGSGGLEGLRLLQLIRQRTGPQLVLVATAYGDPGHAPAAARLGADVYLHKPVSLGWLAGLLFERIERQRQGRGTAAGIRALT
jgi:ATP-dependent Lon protease